MISEFCYGVVEHAWGGHPLGTLVAVVGWSNPDDRNTNGRRCEVMRVQFTRDGQRMLQGGPAHVNQHWIRVLTSEEVAHYQGDALKRVNEY